MRWIGATPAYVGHVPVPFRHLPACCRVVLTIAYCQVRVKVTCVGHPSDGGAHKHVRKLRFCAMINKILRNWPLLVNGGRP